MPYAFSLAADGWDEEDEAGPVEDLTDPAVVVEDLWIRYRTTSEKGTSLKQAVTAQHKERIKTNRYVEALRGVSFEVPTGGVYGVIGHNGAGKSTLFRTIAGILAPTRGRVSVAGRVTPLLALGVGFNQELTGRENILLGGLATGLHPEEILAHYDEVVAFAELGDALDYPMRTYSSGMFARLGFAVASHLDPEILLIDEALSAGDTKFKRRASAKMSEIMNTARTMLLVSHGLGTIKDLCNDCIWMDHGRLMMRGTPDDCVAAYNESVNAAESSLTLEDI